MIVDCTLFYNEVDMLLYRLKVMYPVVDKFIIVESTKTHRGNYKEMHFEKNKKVFEKYLDKIIYVIDDQLLDDPGPWENEIHQRNYAIHALHEFAQDDDIILLSDVDEIFNPEVIKKLNFEKCVTMQMDMYYYNIETKLKDPWTLPKAIRYKYLTSINETRGMSAPVIPGAGWHLSYFGDEKMIINKLKNFSHAELSYYYSYDDIVSINNVIKNKTPVHSFVDNYVPVEIIHVPISENTNLPPEYTEIKVIVEDYDVPFVR
jgi:beta-1,4-mannosyl-glycoprotein beta-1,4-N-acetylglucosaminyltransferase